MTSIKDIAAEAGVSIAAVSMALNNKKGLSDATRFRIIGIAKAMNYIPSRSAISLKTNRTHTLGLVVGNLENTYFNSIIKSANDAAAKRGYNIFICDGGLNLENTISAVKALMSQSVDGILFSLAFNISKEFVDVLHQAQGMGIQLVSLTRCIEDKRIPYVTFVDDEEVRQLMVSMIELGHSQIAAIGATQGSWLNNYRLRTYSGVMKEHSYYRPEIIRYTNLSLEDGKRAAADILDNHPEVTAIFGINDIVAIGAMQMAQQRGLRVPEDISIFGADGINIASFTTPTLTTISTPRHEIGRVATKMIIDMIEDETESNEEEMSQNILIPSTYQSGNSIGLARAATLPQQ